MPIVRKQLQQKLYLKLRPKINNQTIHPNARYAQTNTTNRKLNLTQQVPINTHQQKPTVSQPQSNKLEEMKTKLIGKMDLMLNILTVLVAKLN